MIRKKTVSPQSSLSYLSQNTTPFTEITNPLHSSKISLNDEMEIQQASSSAPATVIHDPKTLQKIKILHLIFQSPLREKTML